jgi:hypothetical protein
MQSAMTAASGTGGFRGSNPGTRLLSNTLAAAVLLVRVEDCFRGQPASEREQPQHAAGQDHYPECAEVPVALADCLLDGRG